MLWLTIFVSRSGELVTGDSWPDSEEFHLSGKDGAHRRQSRFLHNDSRNPVFNNQLFSHNQPFGIHNDPSKWNKDAIDSYQTRVGGEINGKCWRSSCCFSRLNHSFWHHRLTRLNMSSLYFHIGNINASWLNLKKSPLFLFFFRNFTSEDINWFNFCQHPCLVKSAWLTEGAASPPAEGQQIIIKKKKTPDAVNPSAPRQGFLFYLGEPRKAAAQRYRVSKSSQTISRASVSPTADRGELTADEPEAVETDDPSETGREQTKDTEALQTWT